MLYCKFCGNQIEDDSKYCVSCGKEINLKRVLYKNEENIVNSNVNELDEVEKMINYFSQKINEYTKVKYFTQ